MKLEDRERDDYGRRDADTLRVPKVEEPSCVKLEGHTASLFIKDEDNNVTLKVEDSNVTEVKPKVEIESSTPKLEAKDLLCKVEEGEVKPKLEFGAVPKREKDDVESPMKSLEASLQPEDASSSDLRKMQEESVIDFGPGADPEARAASDDCTVPSLDDTDRNACVSILDSATLDQVSGSRSTAGPPSDVRGRILARETPTVIVKAEPVDMDVDSPLDSTEVPERRPEKRRRIVMDGVDVPLVLSARAHADAERQALDKKWETMLRNPKVKKSEKTPKLSLDTVRARLRQHNISLEPYPVELKPDILEVTVTRDFMSSEYGGSPQGTCPDIAQKFFDRTGLDNFLYLRLDLNPECPQRPGAPGLIFNGRCAWMIEAELARAKIKLEVEEEEKQEKQSKEDRNQEPEDTEEKEEDDGEDKDAGEPPYILFARLDASVWHYQGQYLIANTGTLTVNEWKQQPPKVRRTWATELSKRPWGLEIRADIALRRRLGRRPTEAEVNLAINNKDPCLLTVTPDDITKAFNCGQAIISVETMECVGYLTELQRNIAERMPNFVPKTKSKSKLPNPKPLKRDPGHPEPSKVAGRKRKRVEVESDDEVDEDLNVESEDEDDDSEPELIYRHRGTRSRPIIL